MPDIPSGPIRVIGLRNVEVKLEAAEANILVQNRLMVQAILDQVKPITIQNTPTGPGHFGYHLRDRFTTDVKQHGLRTVGVLKAPAQGYWREYGTRRGERAYKTAHRAARNFKQVAKFYYGGLAQWWGAR